MVMIDVTRSFLIITLCFIEVLSVEHDAKHAGAAKNDAKHAGAAKNGAKHSGVAKNDSSETLVRTKRIIPARDEYDYIEDFQEDEAVHSSAIRLQRNAVENSTLPLKNGKEVPSNNKRSSIAKRKLASFSGNVSVNPRNDIENFFLDIASKNRPASTKSGVKRVDEQKQSSCTKANEAGCGGDDLDNIFSNIVEKGITTVEKRKITTSSAKHDEVTEVEAIDNVFNKLVQKAPPDHVTAHVTKRNIDKQSETLNKIEKLRNMFQVMNKRSTDGVEEEEEEENDGESGSGSHEEGSGTTTSHEQESHVADGKEPVHQKNKRSLDDDEDEVVTRHHRSTTEETTRTDRGSHVRNPRSRILEKNDKHFPDIPLPFIHERSKDAESSGAFSPDHVDIELGEESRKVQRRDTSDLSSYPAFTKLIPFKEYRSLESFKRALGDEKFHSLQVIDKKKAQHLFDDEDGAFLKYIKKDGIYYDTRSKHFLISSQHLPPVNMLNYEKTSQHDVKPNDKKSTKYFNETIGATSLDTMETNLHEDRNIISYQRKKFVKKLPAKKGMIGGNEFIFKPTHGNSSYYNKSTSPANSCRKPCYTPVDVMTLSKRQILTDDNPDTDKIMGNDGFDLDEEEKSKIRKAENLYKFARNVIEVVANNTVIKRKRRDDKSHDLIGVWSGLGTVPEFIHYKDYTHDVRKTKGGSDATKRHVTYLPLSDTTMDPKKHARLKKSLVMMNGDNHHFYQDNAHQGKPKVATSNQIKKGKVVSSSANLPNKNNANKKKRNVVTQRATLTSVDATKVNTNTPVVAHAGVRNNIEQSESKQIEIGSLGSMNMVPQIAKSKVEQKSKITKVEQLSKTTKEKGKPESRKIKREDEGPPNSVNTKPVQDGKVVLAFDEVKELLPTKHFFKENYGDDIENNADEDRNLRSDIPLPNQSIDVDRELSDSMMLAGDLESSPYKPLADTATIDNEGHFTHGRDKDESNNIISMFNAHKKLKHNQVKYHDDETKEKYSQMKHWLESDRASSYQKEADTAKKIQEVINKLARSDAELHRLTTEMKNDTSPAPVKPVVVDTVNVAEIKEEERDDRFKTLEKEIQEEHANYRKLIQQQQKQYDERLKAQAQLAKMQKEIDNLSLLHSTNSSVLLGNFESYDNKQNSSVGQPLSKHEIEKVTSASNSSVSTDLGNKTASQNQSIPGAEILKLVPGVATSTLANTTSGTEPSIPSPALTASNSSSVVVSATKTPATSTSTAVVTESPSTTSTQINPVVAAVANPNGAQPSLPLLPPPPPKPVPAPVPSPPSAPPVPAPVQAPAPPAPAPAPAPASAPPAPAPAAVPPTPVPVLAAALAPVATVVPAPIPPPAVSGLPPPIPAQPPLPPPPAPLAPPTSDNKTVVNMGNPVLGNGVHTLPGVAITNPNGTSTIKELEDMGKYIMSKYKGNMIEDLKSQPSTETRSPPVVNQTLTSEQSASSQSSFPFPMEIAYKPEVANHASPLVRIPYVHPRSDDSSHMTTDNNTVNPQTTTTLQTETANTNHSPYTSSTSSAITSTADSNAQIPTSTTDILSESPTTTAKTVDVATSSANAQQVTGDVLHTLPGISISNDGTSVMKAGDIAGMYKHLEGKYKESAPHVLTEVASQLPTARSITPVVDQTITSVQRSHTSFPFPLEVAYKPKVVNHTAAFVRRPGIEFLEVGYVGCYIDRLDEGRDLPVRAGIPLVTPHNCIAACRTTGYRYAGLQYGYLCFCGNGYGKYDIVPDSECNTVCSGNDSFTCGGLWRNEIFETEAAKPTTSAFDVNIEMMEQEQRKSIIPSITDMITDNTPASAPSTKAVEGSKGAGEELLNEIHKYAINDLKALEEETQDAASHSQHDIVRAVQNMTDEEIINNAKAQDDQAPTSLLEPLSTAFQDDDVTNKSPVLLNYYQNPAAKKEEGEEEEKRSSLATPVKIEPMGTALQNDGATNKPPVLLNYYTKPAVKKEEEESKQSSSETPVQIEPGTLLFRGEILLKQLWYDELQSRDSVKFKILSGNIETAVKNIFSSDPSFLKTEVMSLREAGRRVPSRTVADFALTFYKNESSDAVTDTILSALAGSGKLDGMPVYPQTLKIKEYTMDTNAGAYLPSLVHPVDGKLLPSNLNTPIQSTVDAESASRSYIARQPEASPYMTSLVGILPSRYKAPPSNSARAHIRPVTVDAQAKLRNYMSTQGENPDVNMMIRSVAPNEREPKEMQKRNTNVPYVLRMFFWKDMLARKKREDKDDKVKKKDIVPAALFDAKPRRSLEKDEMEGRTVTREKRSQADNWPTLFKGDAQKNKEQSASTSHSLKRVKRVSPEEEAAISAEIDGTASKSFYRDLDSDFERLFDDPTNKTVPSASKVYKKHTLFGKISSDKLNNHDRMNVTTSKNNRRRHRVKSRETNGTNGSFT